MSHDEDNRIITWPSGIKWVPACIANPAPKIIELFHFREVDLPDGTKDLTIDVIERKTRQPDGTYVSEFHNKYGFPLPPEWFKPAPLKDEVKLVPHYNPITVAPAFYHMAEAEPTPPVVKPSWHSALLSKLRRFGFKGKTK